MIKKTMGQRLKKDLQNKHLKVFVFLGVRYSNCNVKQQITFTGW